MTKQHLNNTSKHQKQQEKVKGIVQNVHDSGVTNYIMS